MKTKNIISNIPYETYSMMIGLSYGVLFIGGMLSLPYVMTGIKMLMSVL